MATVTHRHIVTFRWVCTDKERCEDLDAQIDYFTGQSNKLSGYVAGKHISGLQCITLDGKINRLIKDLREERASLWRRVKVETDEEVIEDGEPESNISTSAVLP